MITVKHSPTGKGSVVFNDDKPLILIRAGGWTFYGTKITVFEPPKEIHRELVKIALTNKTVDKIKHCLLLLGSDNVFSYEDGFFREDSIRKTEIELGEIL